MKKARFTNHKLLAFSLLTVLLNGFSLANAATPSKTFGYWGAIPNAQFSTGIWPGNGTGTQLTTAENNPDVWCSDQAQGFRTPYAREMNDKHKKIVHPGATTPSGPEGTNERKISKSLYNEWGNVKLYVDSGWDVADNTFWVAEPASTTERYAYNPVDGELIKTQSNQQRYVVCISSIQ